MIASTSRAARTLLMVSALAAGALAGACSGSDTGAGPGDVGVDGVDDTGGGDVSNDTTDTSDGDASDGDTSDGDASDGDTSDGDASDGDASDGGDTDVVEPPVCDEGERSCGDDGEILVCVDGVLEVDGGCLGACVIVADEPVCGCDGPADCAAGTFCSEDALCEPHVCAPDSARCEGDTAVTCREDGSGEVPVSCAPLSCTGAGVCACTDNAQCGPDAFCNTFLGACVPNVCTPSADYCVFNSVQTCNAEGTGGTPVRNCLSSCVDEDGEAWCGCDTDANCRTSEYCSPTGPGGVGVCLPDVCIGGSRRCTGSVAELCRANGSAWDATDCDPLLCSAGQCICTADAQCGAGRYCSAGSCFDQVCEPNALFCDGDDVRRCSATGSFAVTEESCPGGCVDGACFCADASDCGMNEACVANACVCPTSTCGESGICCPGGTQCETREFCDAGVCFTSSLCLAPCPSGERCGAFGQSCCTGATPFCGPGNTCIPDCGGNANCGADLDVCCDAGEFCIFGACRASTLSCDSFVDCDYDEYCEPLLGECLPNDFPVECSEPGDFDEFDPEVLWHWEGHTVGGVFYRNVMSTPMVADMNGDGVPDVVFQAYGNSLGTAGVFVVNGATGQTIYANTTRTLHGAGHVALADVDGDGYPEIATAMDSGIGLIQDIVNCPNPGAPGVNGCYAWTYNSGTLNRRIDGGAPGFVDFNGDGNVELFMGSVVLNARTGALVVDGGTGSTGVGGMGGQYISITADLNADGAPELLTGDCAWKINVAAGTRSQVWCNNDFSNGFPGVADFTLSGTPEVVVVQSGRVYVLNGLTGATLHDFPLPGGGHGGPPNIADFDGDGRPEVGTAGQGCYTVYDLDCVGPANQNLPGCERPTFPACTPGVDCVVEPCGSVTNGTGNGILWSVVTKDTSSSTTGSSVFDFQGDGVNEVIYNDECRLLVLDGRTGAPFLSLPNTSRTNSEYPIVVDVNGDRRSELLIAANNDEFNRDCAALVADRPDLFPMCHGPGPYPPFCTGGTAGVFAFTDPNDSWVRTRAIWNQHAYDITNINDDATVPEYHLPHWGIFNTYRANRQGEVPLNSPDPAIVSFNASLRECPPVVTLTAVVANQGTRGIPAGMPVQFFRETATDTELLATVTTTGPLFPGQVEQVSYQLTLPANELSVAFTYIVTVNGDGSFSPDCNPDDNARSVLDVRCIPDDPIVSQ